MGHCKTLDGDNPVCVLKDHLDQNQIRSVENDILVQTLIILLVIVGIFHVLITRRRGSKLENVPFLPSLPIIGPLHHFLQNRHNVQKMLEDWAVRYENLAKTYVLGYPVVIIHSPAMLQKLHHSTNPGHLEKPHAIYSKLFPGRMEHGLFMSKVEIWTRHRTVLQKAYNYESLKSYVPIINTHGQNLVTDLQDMLELQNTENLETLLHKCCLEVILELVLGASVSSAFTLNERVDSHNKLQRLLDIINYRFYRPWLLPNLIWSMHPYKREVEKIVECMEKIATKLMETRKNYIANVENQKKFKTENDEKIAFDLMLKANFSEEDMFVCVTSLISGGHETIKTALMFIVYLLASHLEHQQTCREEVDELWSSLETSGESLSIESLSKLKYVERCVKETLRMFPTAPINWRHLKAPLQLGDDIVLEAGTEVVWTVWALHRNPKYWPNPDKFDPDRFLPENCKNRQPHTYIPFSAGSRNCIGWKMAMIEMTILSAFLLRNFEFDTDVRVEDVKINFSVTIAPTKDLGIKLKPRGL